MRVGFVTGLRAEARCLPKDAAVGCSGANAARARAKARRLIEGGCTALVSFGLAGALRPRLLPGDLVIADAVLVPGGAALQTDAAWSKRLRGRLEAASLRVHCGAVAGSDHLIDTPAAKRRLYATTHALAVDMESHGVAEAAREASVPVIVVRAISDPHDRAVPALASDAVGADGRVRVATALRHIARRPGELPALVRLALDTGRALATLHAVVRAAGPTLAAHGQGRRPREPHR